MGGSRRASHHGTGGYIVLDSSYRGWGGLPPPTATTGTYTELQTSPPPRMLRCTTFYGVWFLWTSPRFDGRKNDVMYSGGVEGVDIETRRGAVPVA